MVDLSKIKGAIFDADGTLFDSMWKWQSVERGYIESLGIVAEDGLEDVLRKLSQQEVAEYFKEKYGLEKSVQEITDEKNDIMELFYNNEVTLKPGTAELLEKLKSLGIKMCVATASDRYLIDAGLKRLGIFEYFETTLTCPDENTTKSVPDIFIKAANVLGTEISETAVFEDAIHGVTSAKKAGFTVVAVYDDSMANVQDEIKQLADYHFKDLSYVAPGCPQSV
ncbi:MAG: HAD family phosphatase [Oscillospiraceae bacterium]|nr:HAD family phosphatase [Oscillospiraceae bacterium]